MPSFHADVFRRREGGHDTFTCWIKCSKTRFWSLLWSVEKHYWWFAVFWLAVIFQWDFRLEADQKTKWCRQGKFLWGQVFFCVTCSWSPDEISTIILWRQSVVQVKMFWPFSWGVSWKPQRCWNVSKLFTKWKQWYIPSLDPWVAHNLVLDIIFSLL